MKYLLSFLGFIFAHTPECMLKGLCNFVAFFIMKVMKKRANVAFSNINHCFPELSEAETKSLVFESCSRMVEMALFVVASPHMSIENLRARIKVSDYVMKELASFSENPKPTVLMIPHFCMMETITMFPALVDMKLPKVGVFYRPFDSQSLEDWVKSSRERFGLELLSRKKGLAACVKFLRSNGIVAILYDQNAGYSGTLSLFFDRICSTSELPGILVERAHADVAVFYARRTGFWRSEIDGQRFSATTVDEVTYHGNKWLESHMKADPIARMDWLWLHHRWNALTYPLSILNNKRNGRNIIDYFLERDGLKIPQRKSRIFINCEPSFSDTLALLPFVKTLRKSRDDCTVTLICPRDFSDAIEMFGVADKVIAAPFESAPNSEKREFYKQASKYYPDIYLTLRDSEFDDETTKLMLVQFSMGVTLGRPRKKFRYVVDISSAKCAVEKYELFFRKLGMKGDVDFSPLKVSVSKDVETTNSIALILNGGNRNTYNQNLADLIKSLSARVNAKFVIFANCQNCAREIAEKSGLADVVSYAGNLSESEFAQKIQSCSLIIGGDCNFVRMANALGVPVALIGNTCDSLVFNAPKCEINLTDAFSAESVASQLEMFFKKEGDSSDD